MEPNYFIALILDNNSKVIDANDHFLNITGCTIEEITGKAFSDLPIWEDHKTAESAAALCRSCCSIDNFKVSIHRKEGPPLNCLMSSYNQNIHGETVKIVTIRDIGDDGCLNAEQRKFTEMLQMLNALAHHWRQPLNSLGLLIQDLSDVYKSGMLDMNYINEFEKVGMKNIMSMSDVIDQFCDLYQTKKLSGKFDILESVRMAAEKIKGRLIADEIDISISSQENEESCCYVCETEQSLTLTGSKDEFVSMISSLLSNSADAIDRKRKHLPDHQGVIRICVKKTSDCIYISVLDNGDGIDEEVISRIFDPYFTTEEHSAKTGNSLFIAKVLIENHFNGTISAFSRTSMTEFVIVLPLTVSRESKKCPETSF